MTIEILWYLKLSKSFKCNKNWQNDKLLRAYWSAIIILYSNCQSNLLMDGVMVYFTIYFTESGLGDDVWNICCQKLEYLIIFDSPFESSRFSIVSRFSSLVVFRNFDFWGAQIFFKRLNSSGGWSGFRTKDSVFIHIVPGTSSVVSKFLIIFVINTTKIVCFIWKRKKVYFTTVEPVNSEFYSI